MGRATAWLIMYLNTVLEDIRKTKALHAEHLYKLNEAVFNLPEEDAENLQMLSKIFKVLEGIHNQYRAGKVSRSDPDFFYDYLALLGTMQNQHFVTQAQTVTILDWMREVYASGETGGPGMGKSTKGAGTKDLEAQNRELKKEVQKLEKYKKMAESIKAQDDKPVTAAKGKSKGKEEPISKGKGKGKEEPIAKGKAKGKGKVDEHTVSGKGKKGKKGKGKSVDDEDDEDEDDNDDDDDDDDDDDEYDPPAKGKGKAASKGKAKGKGKDEPVGKGKKGKGKSR